MKDKIEVNLRDSYWQLYESYLEYYKTAWTPACQKSEASRVKKIIHIMKTESGLSGNEFHKALIARGYGSYTIKVMLIRAAHFFDFGVRRGVFNGASNPFNDEMHRARSVMRGAYRKERLKIDFDKAKELILSIEDTDMREFCLALLASGLRISEAYKVDHETGFVIGKGNKERKVFFNYKKTPPPKHKVRDTLRTLGLKPHSLRKLLATRLARSEMSHADIMKFFGWNSISTAESYYQSRSDDAIKSILSEVLGE